MPHRRPKNSIVIATVAAVAVAAPFAVQTLGSDSITVRFINGTSPSIPTEIAEVLLTSVPEVVVPLAELEAITGLDIPDIDLRNLQLPTEIPLPGGGSIPLSPLTSPAIPGDPAVPDVPAAPGDVAVPAPASETAVPSLADQLGATVKEITRDEPFSMVALTSADLESVVTKLRVKLEDGTWGEWFAPEGIDSQTADMATVSGKQGSDPVYVGETNAMQILVAPKDSGTTGQTAPGGEGASAAQTPAPANSPAPETSQPLGYAPAAVSNPLPAAVSNPLPAAVSNPLPAAVSNPLPAATITADDISAVLITPGTGPQDSNLADIATPASVNGINIISRSGWGADENIRCSDPIYDDSLGGATVHHTAESNNYTKRESAGIVRGIYAYHAQTLGWCDIGYNVLVDRFGQIFEGRYGGLDRPVRGAHAGGFNENTIGIAMMGNFQNVAAPAATIESLGKFLGWRLKLANLNPKGWTTMYSEGTSYTKYPKGQAVNLPIIFAHRDVGYTVCPGDSAYAQMDQVRDIAAGNWNAGSVPAPAPSPGGGTSPDVGVNVGSLDLDAQIPAAIDSLLSMADSNPIVREWLALGGDSGMLGDAITGLLTTAAGSLYAFFENGALVTSPNGDVVTMLGEIFNAWQNAGGVLADIGLPVTDEYRVDGGFRSDFENGSMLYDEATQQITTVVTKPAPGAASAPAPTAPAPTAPSPTAPPGETPVRIN
ncbi:N-acetylmuramoyl-L-alanine amidase [Rhodococcus spongiicola]|uniref:Cold-shock protein n=1 Tax=Rhodococcus spongiicola TaxID=2487352 RepID=A0A3S3DVM7_9NOCA|nr:cold-shock protein [Rhodococcus spongiicola]